MPNRTSSRQRDDWNCTSMVLLQLLFAPVIVALLVLLLPVACVRTLFACQVGRKRLLVVVSRESAVQAVLRRVPSLLEESLGTEWHIHLIAIAPDITEPRAIGPLPVIATHVSTDGQFRKTDEEAVSVAERLMPNLLIVTSPELFERASACPSVLLLKP